MTTTQFCYWLQGFFELSNKDIALTQEQTDIVKRHLNLVFVHDIDPQTPDPTGQLQLIHDGQIPNIIPLDQQHLFTGRDEFGIPCRC